MKLISGITLLLCVFSISLRAQPKTLPDSIRVEMPEHHAIVTFELRQYLENKKVIQTFPKQLEKLLNHINKSITASDKQQPHSIEVIFQEQEEKNDAEKYTISIHEIHETETKVTVNGNEMVELLPPGWELHIKMKVAEITVYAPDLEKLTALVQLNLEPVIAHLDTDPEVQQQKRFGIISRIIFKEGKVQTAQTSHRESADMLGLHAGAGVGLVRDKFYPEFNFTTSFYFANRYKEDHQRISAHYELKLFTGRSPEGEYRSQPASFVSVSYALNFRKDRPRWTGLGVGYLVNNRSDLFTGKTMKIFLESDIGSPKLNIIPELYLTNDFKQALFGLKLNYKF